jgi:hypothetical protein
VSSGYCEFKRERERERPTVGMKEGGQGGRKMEGEWRGVQGQLQGVLLGLQSKQEVARSTSREPPRSSSPFKGRRQEDFVKSPLTLEGFLGKTKQHLFLLFGDSKLF